MQPVPQLFFRIAPSVGLRWKRRISFQQVVENRVEILFTFAVTRSKKSIGKGAHIAFLIEEGGKKPQDSAGGRRSFRFLRCFAASPSTLRGRLYFATLPLIPLCFQQSVKNTVEIPIVKPVARSVFRIVSGCVETVEYAGRVFNIMLKTMLNKLLAV